MLAGYRFYNIMRVVKVENEYFNAVVHTKRCGGAVHNMETVL